MKTKRRSRLSSLTRALLGMVLAACGGATPEPAPSASPPGPSEATAVTAPLLPIRSARDVRTFEATGRLLSSPAGRAEITLPLLSTIVLLEVAPGQTVEAGQVLAEIVVPEAARAQGQLEGAQLQADAHAQRLAQLEQLRGEGLARGAELAEARARLADAQASAREARAVLDTLASSGLRRRGKHYEVRAPLAGVVTMVNAWLGSSRGPSDGPICAISAGLPTRVEARFAFALPSSAHYEAWSGDQLLGELRLVAQAPDVSAGDATRLAWFDLAGPSELPPGSTIQVRLRLPVDSWVIPRAALRAGTPAQVFTQRAGLVPIEVLATLGSELLVRAALSPDDLLAENEAAP